MHFGISEGKGGLKHGSRPWLGMDIFWNCPILFNAFEFYIWLLAFTLPRCHLIYTLAVRDISLSQEHNPVNDWT